MKNHGRTYIPALSGAYASEDDLRTWAREFFLNVIWSAVPAPLYSLRDEILPKYRAAFRFKKGRRSRTEVKDLSVIALMDVVLADQKEDLKSLPEYRSVREASLPSYEAAEHLLAWSKRFNLTGRQSQLDEAADPTIAKTARMDSLWPLIAGLETILTWLFSRAGVVQTPAGLPLWRCKPFKLPNEAQILRPIRLQTIRYDPRAGISRELLQELDPNGPPVKDPEEVDTPGWFLELEEEGGFRSRVSKDFKRWLDGYIAIRRESARKEGLIKAPGKRDLSHFIWAARYQVEGTPASDLAKEYNVTKEAVSEGINWVLDLIRLEPRVGRRGPKRGRSSPAK
jgi:hypothetical protein